MFFDKGSDDFLMKLNRVRETDGSACQPFDSDSQYQVVALNALSKNLAGHMLILRHLSGITPPVIAGYHTDVKRGKRRASNSRQVSSVRGPTV